MSNQELGNHKEFVYKNYSIIEMDNKIKLSYDFLIDNEHIFIPTWEIDIVNRIHYNKSILHNLVFNLGIVESISYWKTCCPEVLSIECGEYEIDTAFYKKLFKLGLGEFFYTNGITPNDSFINIQHRCKNTIHFSLPNVTYSNSISNSTKVLIPIGGGKDSAVTIELLKDGFDRYCYIINPRLATIDTFTMSGIPKDKLIVAKRNIDKHLLEMNNMGYLNGHTPFSAVVAFSSVIAAYINGISYVALSNENSANESTIMNTKINHQYSKTLEFENDFRKYNCDFINSGVNYFSFLRPLTEIGIAKIFSKLDKYHNVFKSCNVGSKIDTWCGNCPKCLFVFIILSAFLGVEYMTKVFGKNMLSDEKLKQTLDKLIGIIPEKPFECVGSREEVIACMTYISDVDINKDLPLVTYFKSLNMKSNKSISNLTSEMDFPNNLDDKFMNALKMGVDKYINDK